MTQESSPAASPRRSGWAQKRRAVRWGGGGRSQGDQGWGPTHHGHGIGGQQLLGGHISGSRLTLVKVYTKVTRGMEMKMARGRFLGTVVERVSIGSCGAGVGPQGGTGL